MADEITIVALRNRCGESNRWEVEFSEPVYHPRFSMRSSTWDVDTPEGNWLLTDELGAFMWAQNIIEKHKERVSGKRHNRG